MPGKTVIIYFYPKDNTPGCSKEACGFRDSNQKLRENGIVLLGVSKDSIASHNKFIDAFGLPFVLLSDPETTMMQAYKAFGEKVTCGKKTIGIIRSTVVIGPDGIVRKTLAQGCQGGTTSRPGAGISGDFITRLPQQQGGVCHETDLYLSQPCCF